MVQVVGKRARRAPGPFCARVKPIDVRANPVASGSIRPVGLSLRVGESRDTATQTGGTDTNGSTTLGTTTGNLFDGLVDIPQFQKEFLAGPVCSRLLRLGLVPRGASRSDGPTTPHGSPKNEDGPPRSGSPSSPSPQTRPPSSCQAASQSTTTTMPEQEPTPVRFGLPAPTAALRLAEAVAMRRAASRFSEIRLAAPGRAPCAARRTVETRPSVAEPHAARR